MGVRRRLRRGAHSTVVAMEADAAHVRELCDRRGLRDITNLAVCSYRCCESMSRLWPADPDAVREVILQELRAARAV